MASLEDYDEFGNYIGADLDSDDEADVQQDDLPQQAQQQTLEGFEDDAMQTEQEGALMEVDGV
jgi:116 kDa U5 small nuclear ribonucleoprotein component